MGLHFLGLAAQYRTYTVCSLRECGVSGSDAFVFVCNSLTAGSAVAQQRLSTGTKKRSEENFHQVLHSMNRLVPCHLFLKAQHMESFLLCSTSNITALAAALRSVLSFRELSRGMAV